jgi:glycosyltransferase involved in cell wall biosynthesis
MPAKITYLLPNLESGGTERQVLALGRRLDRARFSPSLVTTAGGGSLYRDFSDVMPVTVHGGDPTQSKRFRSSPREHFRTIRLLAGEFRRTRPDILHAYLPSPNVLGPIAAEIGGGTRVIVSKRGLADYKKNFYFLPRLVEPLGNRLADRILVNSDAVMRDVERTEKHWEGKFRKIYNGVAPIAAWTEEEQRAFRAREGIPAGARVVLCVSNFYPYKGHADLVEAAALVAAAVPEVLFLLVGRDAGTVEHCRNLARERSVDRNIRFLGGRSDVPDLIRASDLFVHPSHEEGFSNAILEAMAGGKPVVAYDVGGNPEAVEDGETGLLVPLRGSEALADAMMCLLRDPELRTNMGEKGRERATEHFSLERMVQEMEGLYESLVEEEA